MLKRLVLFILVALTFASCMYVAPQHGPYYHRPWHGHYNHGYHRGMRG